MADLDVYVEFDDNARRIFEDYKQAAEVAAQWEDIRQKAGVELARIMGNANKGTIDGRHVVTRIAPTKVNIFQTAKFKNAFPNLYAQYCELKPRAGMLRLVKRDEQT